eukprot:11208718-Lingulodinium_polyedra.AAC.1
MSDAIQVKRLHGLILNSVNDIVQIQHKKAQATERILVLLLDQLKRIVFFLGQEDRDVLLGFVNITILLAK